MAGLRQLLMGGDNSDFCASHYETHCSEEPQHQRIVVRVLLPNGFPLQAVIDTASDWCILNPEIIEAIRDDAEYENEIKKGDKRKDRIEGDVIGIRIRGTPYQGQMARLTLTLPAEAGGSDQSYSIETTVFIPRLGSGERWLLPSFIGLNNFLNKIPWAIDPDEELFFFGPVSDTHE